MLSLSEGGQQVFRCALAHGSLYASLNAPICHGQPVGRPGQPFECVARSRELRHKRFQRLVLVELRLACDDAYVGLRRYGHCSSVGRSRHALCRALRCNRRQPIVQDVKFPVQCRNIRLDAPDFLIQAADFSLHATGKGVGFHWCRARLLNCACWQVPVQVPAWPLAPVRCCSCSWWILTH